MINHFTLLILSSTLTDFFEEILGPFYGFGGLVFFGLLVLRHIAIKYEENKSAREARENEELLSAKAAKRRNEANRKAKEKPHHPQSSDKLEVEEEIESVGYGSGVLISQEGIIITNYHVVDGAKSIEIKFPGLKTIYSAEVVAKDPHTDIAVLKIDSYGKSVENGKSIPLTKNSKKIQSGLEVHTIGYPLGNIMGESPRLSSGRISSPFGIHDDPRHFQIDNPIQSGNSGGVVFDNLGNIMGIIVASINDELVYSVTGSISQNINFAIKFSYIQALLDNTNYEIDYSSLSNEDIKLEDLVAKIQPFTCQITSKS